MSQSRCKGTTFPTPQFPKRHETSWTCELLRLIASYLVHRPLFYPQIITDLHRFLNIKDILIITDFLFWHGNPRLYFDKDTAWLRIDKTRHFVITACFASSRLSLLCGNEPCLYFSIALIQIKPLPITQPAVSFLKPCPSVPKIIINQ